jgi:pyrophosphatase PpaX
MYAIEKLSGRSVDAVEVQATFGEVLTDSMRKLLPEVSPEEAIETYRAYQADRYLDEIRLYDGAEQTLKVLRGHGLKTALVTSRLKRTTMLGLEHFDLVKYFDAIITADDITVHKPDPEPIFITLKALGREPEHAIMVGDTKHDLGAAKNAGVISLLVDYSVALPPERRATAGVQADIVIDKLMDIPVLLGLEEA